MQFAHPIDASAFRESWAHASVAKISGLLPAASMAALRTVVDRSYAAIAGEIARGARLDPYFADNFVRWHGVNAKHLGPFLAEREPALAEKWLEILTEIERSFLRLFGEKWQLCPEISWFRRHHDHTKYVPWHIDADAGAGYAFGTECTNIWLPLESVGAAAPSVELMPGSHKIMRRHRLLRANGGDRYRTEDWVRANVACEAWTPQAELGDAVLFDQYVLHRTQRGEFAAAARSSCEFRFVVPRPLYWRMARSAKAAVRQLAASGLINI
jgi:hypothetical protein